jgi:adenosylmethionine---8-amino-7-oxononanoate aminotransferase
VFKRPFAGVLLDCVHAPLPEPGEPDGAGHARAFAALERMVADAADEVAALVLEPRLQGAAGMRIYDAELLRRARAACDAHDVLLVADEVFTGYGRAGEMWACQSAGISPDLLCTAKGFTAGTLPMAATLCTTRVFDAFRGAPQRAFWHGHSYCGNPLGAAVAREVLAVYRDERILERSAAKAARIAAAFEELGRLPGARRPRALGMVGAIDLDADPGYLGDRGWRAYDEARRLGAYLRPLGNVVYVAPPINIDDDDLEELLDIVKRAVAFALA